MDNLRLLFFMNDSSVLRRYNTLINLATSSDLTEEFRKRNWKDAYATLKIFLINYFANNKQLLPEEDLIFLNETGEIKVQLKFCSYSIDTRNMGRKEFMDVMSLKLLEKVMNDGISYIEKQRGLMDLVDQSRYHTNRFEYYCYQYTLSKLFINKNTIDFNDYIHSSNILFRKFQEEQIKNEIISTNKKLDRIKTDKDIISLKNFNECQTIEDFSSLLLKNNLSYLNDVLTKKEV